MGEYIILSQRWLFKYIGLFIIFLVGIFFSISSYYFVETVEYENLQLEFQKRSDSRINSFKREMVLNFEVLTGLRAFFSASPNVSREMFLAYASSVLKGRSSIQALDWIPKIKKDERSRYEKLAKQEGLTNFVFTEREQGVMIPVKNRDVYFPVYYTAPLYDNEMALGFDLSSNPTRKKTLLQAIQKNEMIGTNPIILIQGRENQKGFMVFVPVFRKTNDLKKQEQKLLGFIAGVFDVEKIFQAATKHAGGSTRGLWFSIFDRTKKKRKFLYQEVFDYTNTWNTYKQTIFVAQRKWQISIYATNEFKNIHLKSNSFIVMLTSLCFTFIIFAYLKVVLDKHQKNEEIVKLRTQELSIREKQYRQLEQMAKKMEELARTDPLTKLSNRRHFLEKMEIERVRSIRSNKSLSIILIDVDHFKSFNDSHGHDCGDFVLKSLANTMKESIRNQDTIARWGGEEFIILLPETNIGGCKIVAEKIRDKIASQTYLYQDKKLSITITAGATTHKSEESIDECIRKADDALYKGKERGRNEVVIS